MNIGIDVTPSKKKKGVTGVIPGIVLIICLVIIGIFINFTTKDSEKSKIEGIDYQQYKVIEDTIKSCGIKKIISITPDSQLLNGFEGETSKGYRIKTDFSDNVILYLDSSNNVISIRYSNQYYYNNGKILKIFE